MENIKDNEKYIFWSVLYFNKMCDYMYIVKSPFLSLPLFGVIASIFSDNTDSYDL